MPCPIRMGPEPSTTIFFFLDACRAKFSACLVILRFIMKGRCAVLSTQPERRENWPPGEIDPMTKVIRPATADDARACCDIYAPIVLNTHTSFELEPPDEGEMRQRIVATL